MTEEVGMDLGLKDKTALVTGGSRGLGRQIALSLAREGCNVAVCARGKESLEQTVRELRSFGVSALGIQADVTLRSGGDQIVEETRRNLGHLDVLINNVGGSEGKEFDSADDAAWEHTFQLNLFAGIRLIRFCLPAMKKRGWGRIISVASIWGREFGGGLTYMTAKAALISFSKHLAIEVAGTGVTVGGAAEGGTPSVAIGQAVATTSNVTFNNLVVDGTLTVNGATTTVDTTNILVEDPLMFLSSGATGSASVDAGLIVERGDDTNTGFIWDESADQWAAVSTAETGGTAGNVTISAYANMRCLVLTGTATAAQYSDLAERYETDQMYTAGTVVCFGGNAEITQSTELYDSKVAGVISTNPAHLMNAQAGTNETHPAVALTGRVPCKVMGTVRKGDLMVTSAQPGVAMSADERVPGTIIGKAIQDYTDGGIGVIEILVTLM